MRLILDAMGGDHAPKAMVQGAIDYAKAYPQHTVVLVGRAADVQQCLAAEGGKLANIDIEDAPDVIGMAEKIAALKERPNDSMNRSSQLVKQGKGDAMVLCGNTGCSVAAAQMHLRRIPGVRRAAIIGPLPNPKGVTWVCDMGANAVCRPEHLVQFAEMGASFIESAYGTTNPRVGMLSIGEEDGKGDDLTGAALGQLRQTNLNVIGNVEGNDIYTGEVHLVVCDGFTGNVVLKTSEGVFEAILTILKEEIRRGLRTKLGYAMVKPAFDGLRRRADWRLIGGCFLLGVDGICIIGHGRSDRVAVFHALAQAARCVDGKVLPRLRERISASISRDAGAGAA